MLERQNSSNLRILLDIGEKRNFFDFYAYYLTVELRNRSIAPTTVKSSKSNICKKIHEKNTYLCVESHYFGNLIWYNVVETS